MDWNDVSLVEGRYAAPSLAHPARQTLGTPATGDQGADLIAKNNRRTIVIQAKGHAAPVGNSAVQEAVAAISVYNADEGWVVTNSTFTRSARALAHANSIRLIDGNVLLRSLAEHSGACRHNEAFGRHL
jgi:HJR/Mrr/RecB family endonuclease